MQLCGPKLSAFGTVLSLWGVLQLGLTALCFHFRSVALIEDVHLNETYTDPAALANDINVKFEQGALNCWIAALLYLATFCISAQQFYMNTKGVREIPSEKLL